MQYVTKCDLDAGKLHGTCTLHIVSAWLTFLPFLQNVHDSRPEIAIAQYNDYGQQDGNQTVTFENLVD